MVILNSGFTQYPNDTLFHLATKVVVNIGNIASLSTLAPRLPAITTAASDLEKAMALPNGPVRETSVAGARGALIGLLGSLADAINGMPANTVSDADRAAVGMELRQAATHTSQPPAAPGNLRLKATGMSAQLKILLTAVARAVFYEVEYTQDPVNGPWTLAPAFNSTRGIVLTGLTRGKDYYVRVRAVARGQNRGPWSDIASAMVM